MKPLSQLSLEEVRALDATALVRASLLDQQQRELSSGGIQVRHSEPLATVRAKSAPASGMSRNREIAETIASSPTYSKDIAVIEACMKASGQILGEYARESDAKFKSLEEQVKSLSLECAELRGRLEEVKSAQPPGLKRAA